MTPGEAIDLLTNVADEVVTNGKTHSQINVALVVLRQLVTNDERIAAEVANIEIEEK